MARSEYRENTQAWLVEPESMEKLCDYISDGHTLSEYCAEYKLKFRMVHDFIHADNTKLALFNAASNARTAQLEDGVLSSLRNAATIDPRKFFDNSGKLVNVQDLPDNVAASITEISSVVDKEGDETVKIKYTPRHTANQDLGKHLGMFKDRIDLTTNDKDINSTADTELARKLAFILNKADKAQGESNGKAT
jgi:hypothetical protein